MATMLCDKISYQLEAFVDGECRVAEEEMIVDHLEHCATCRQRVDGLRKLNRAVATGLGDVKAPDGLWQRVEAQLSEDLDEHRPPRTKSWFRRPVWQMALAASLLVVMALPAGLTWQWMRQDGSVIAAPIQDFSTYRDSGRNLDIASRDPEIIRSWFASKLTFETPRLEANVAGFDLVGGRLCWLLKRRLSAFAYQRGEQSLSVYVMTAHDLALPDRTFDPELGISLSSHEFDGFRTMIWRAGDLVYTVVSDIPKQDMSIFLAALARSQMVASESMDALFADHGGTDGLMSAQLIQG
jgi:anti-sigma factor RsiW